ncbi:hypothetical protein [Thalassotalea crassostreae]|uniref:hypothetical protein n=1 Tax=Thalassotalea crassostreae TaxID=1763536 RepID=UPI0008391E4D|nr:hypothetical protein [Thalassotalea crassostreae]
MSQLKIDNLEEKYLSFKSMVTDEQWNDPMFIKNRAIKIEKKDLELAYRLMQRAHNLRPTGPVIKRKLNEYRAELEDLKSPILSSKSKSTSNKEIDKTILKKNILTGVWLKKVPPALQHPIYLFVLLPWIIFTFQQIILASPRFESHSQVIVRQPDAQATMDASMALLSGLGVNTGDTDSKLVESYVHSSDMLEYLQQSISIIDHYKTSDADIFSRINAWATQEDILAHYQDFVIVEIDELSSIISIKTQGFTPEAAKEINESIIKRAEWFINNIGHQLASAQLTFIEGEHKIVEKRLENSKKALLNFQQKYNLLDPAAEGVALQQIAYNIEATLSAKRTELNTLEAIMSPDAPQVLSLKRIINSLEGQLREEKSRLTEHSIAENYSVGEISAKYSDYKVDVELSLQAYTSSLVSLEKSRIEAYRQLQYLVVLESPTLPDDNTYPKVIYNISLFIVILLLLFAIVQIISSTIRELR